MSARHLPSLFGAALAALLASPAAEARFLTGSVNIVVRENGDIYSAGEVQCFDSFSNEDSFCRITGSHEIRNTEDDSLLTMRLIDVPDGSYVGFARKSPFQGGCFRAQIIADAFLAEQIIRGSHEVCSDGTLDNCPLLLDLDGNGFHLTGLDDPVRFDFDADGADETAGWTTVGQRDGLLALDRDGDGLINDGRELFGNATLLSSGTPADHGYSALAEFDGSALGGNGDGVIDGADDIFTQLVVWIDADHDGFSLPSELWRAEELGLTRIDLSYVTSRRRDTHGNELRFSGKAWIAGRGGQERPISTTDVFFVTAQ